MSENIKWSSNTTFILALLCYTLSLSSIDTFAVGLIKTHLGCLSAIPLLLIMIFVIIPCRFMELALGQYSNKAAIKVWDICPLFRGIGWNAVIFTIMQELIEHVVSSRMLLYAAMSFYKELPWTSCNHTWVKGECHEMADIYSEFMPCHVNYTVNYCEDVKYLTSIQHFWLARILKLDMTNIYGNLNSELLYCGIATTVLIFCATHKGSKSIEKALWFLFLVPTLQLIILFFATLIDPGGVDGIEYNVAPNYHIFEFKIWVQVLQTFLISSGVGTGLYITFGTQCSFRNPLYLKVVLISLGHLMLTYLYSITIDNFFGIFCYYTDTPRAVFEQSQESYLGVKIVLGMFYMKGLANFWPIMWFSGVYMVALRGLIMVTFLLMEILYNSIPKAQDHQTLTSLFVSSCLFFLSLILYTRIGVLVLNILQTYSYVVIAFLNMLQIIVIVMIYGVTDFMDDVHFMLGIRQPFYWNIYYFFSVLISIYVYVVVMIDYYKEEQYRMNFKWTLWITNIMVWSSYVLVFVFMAKHVAKLINLGHFDKLFYADPDWGPRHLMLRKSRVVFTSHHITTEYMYRQERKRRRLIEAEDNLKIR